MDAKTLWVLAGIGGIVWWMYYRTPPIVPATSGPVETTGAPQPQGVQAYPPAMVDMYDLKAFPMGSFSGR